MCDWGMYKKIGLPPPLIKIVHHLWYSLCKMKIETLIGNSFKVYNNALNLKIFY